MIILFYLLQLFCPNNKTDSDVSILFRKIDNRVIVYHGDSLIYDSGIVELNPNLKIKVVLPKDLDWKNDLVIKLYNGASETLDEGDKHWEIMYTLLVDGNLVDDIWELSDNYSEGLVFEERYSAKELMIINN